MKRGRFSFYARRFDMSSSAAAWHRSCKNIAIPYPHTCTYISRRSSSFLLVHISLQDRGRAWKREGNEEEDAAWTLKKRKGKTEGRKRLLRVTRYNEVNEMPSPATQ